jgi:uncharacterized protein YecE (DUF72 family)
MIKNIEQFLDRLPIADGYDYAVEFRHHSWDTKGPCEMLRQYNIIITSAHKEKALSILAELQSRGISLDVINQ